jgi:hypothetical protein
VPFSIVHYSLIAAHSPHRCSEFQDVLMALICLSFPPPPSLIHKFGILMFMVRLTSIVSWFPLTVIVQARDPSLAWSFGIGWVLHHSSHHKDLYHLLFLVKPCLCRPWWVFPLLWLYHLVDTLNVVFWLQMSSCHLGVGRSSSDVLGWGLWRCWAWLGHGPRLVI